MRLYAIALTAVSFTSLAHADPADFHAGSAIPDFGRIASVEAAGRLPADTVFKVSFDVAKAAEPGELNRSFDSAARFIKMTSPTHQEVREKLLGLINGSGWSHP